MPCEGVREGVGEKGRGRDKAFKPLAREFFKIYIYIRSDNIASRYIQYLQPCTLRFHTQASLTRWSPSLGRFLTLTDTHISHRLSRNYIYIHIVSEVWESNGIAHSLATKGPDSLTLGMERGGGYLALIRCQFQGFPRTLFLQITLKITFKVRWTLRQFV